MSLLAFGFKRVSMEKSSASGDEKCSLIVPNHMATVEEACDLVLGSRDLQYILIWQYINTVIEYRIVILCSMNIEISKWLCSAE